MKKLLILQSENIIYGGKEAEIDKAVLELLELNKPAIVHPANKDNIIFENEISVEKMYLSLEEQGLSSPREISLFQLEVAIKKNEEEIERLNKQSNAIK